MRSLTLTLLATLFVVATAGAGNLGNLMVTVVGPDGAPVVGAEVRAASDTLMGSRSQAASAAGTATLLGLPPGTYTVTVTRDGFAPSETEVRVAQDRTLAIRVVVAPNRFEDTVEVDAATRDESRTATVAEHVTVEMVDAIPIGRDYRAYPQLVAGVTVVPNSSGTETAYEPASKAGNFYHDRGALLGSRDNTYLLEGFDITDMGSGTAGMTLNNRAILEEEVITSGVPAEYPGGAGYVANVVTQSGGNQLSASLEYFLQRPSMIEGFKTSDSRLRAVEENANDFGLTLGGPLVTDHAWFFLAAQERRNSDDVRLSASASPVARVEEYEYRRRNALVKAVAKPLEQLSLTGLYFADPKETTGNRDVTIPPNRYALGDDDAHGVGLQASLLAGAQTLVDLDAFSAKRTVRGLPADPDAGPPNTLLFEPGVTVPAYERMLGSSGDAGRTIQRRGQAGAAVTRVLDGLGTHQVKGGVQWKEWQEENSTQLIFGANLASLAPSLAGLSFAQARELNLLPASEYDVIFRALQASPGSSAFVAADRNGDGVISADEFAALTFASTAGNGGGVNFLRQSLAQPGSNNVGQQSWAVFLQDDWRLDRWTVTLGARAEKVRYFASDGSTILDLDPAWHPRLGITWDIDGSGAHRLSLAYASYSDPLLTPMIRFAGNLSGSVYHDEVFIGDDWFTYRVRGSAVVNRDAGFAPNLKNERESEAQLAYAARLSPTASFLAQAYYRRDFNLIEDYDPNVYFDPAVAGDLVLRPSQFGYGPGGPTGVNYFLGNLVGGRRRAWGLDLSLRRRFADGWSGAVQYSFKRALGNSNSNAAADLQGDFLDLDPRQPYMYGPLPGTIPHQLKLFGSYVTPWGVEIGGLAYWNSGAIYTESDIFRPATHAIYYNHRRADGTYVKTGQQHHPAYATLDLRLSYRLPILSVADCDLVLDVANALNSQKAIRVEEAHNHPEFAYGEDRLLLLPRRYQLGIRLSL